MNICFVPMLWYFVTINLVILASAVGESNIAHQFYEIILLIVEYEVITRCTIYHIMNIKLLVLFSVLLDQFLMFLVYSIAFNAHILFNELELNLLRLQLHIFTFLTTFLNTHPVNLVSCHISQLH